MHACAVKLPKYLKKKTPTHTSSILAIYESAMYV